MSQFTQILVGGVLQGSVFAVVALGISLVYRVTGIINLVQGGFCTIGALALYSFASDFGWPLPLAFLAAIAATAVLGLVLGAATFVPALSRLPTGSMLMLTVGLLTFINGLALVVWGSQPYAVTAFSGEQPIDVLGVLVPSQGLWIAGCTVIIIIGIWLLMTRTAVGTALTACAENPLAARFMGVDVARLTLLSFTLAALIGAIGGAVVAPIMSLQFDAGSFFTNAGFIAVALGGMSSLPGAVAGGLFLGIAEQLAAGYISSLFANGLALGLLLATLLFRPQGLFVPGSRRRHDVREELRVTRSVVRPRPSSVMLTGLPLLLFLVALPYLVSGGFMSSLVIMLILFIAVLGLDVLMGYCGQVNLGQAGFMALGGYTAAILATDYGVSPVIGTLAGIALSLICALLLSAVTMRLRGAYLALATLAFGLLIDSLTVGLTEVTGGPSGLVGIPAFAVGPFVFASPRAMYYLTLAIIVVLIAALAGAMRSDFGRALQAIRADQTAAEALGINVPRHKMAAFAISAVLASLSGSLLAFDFHFLSPEMVATPRSFEMIAMLIVGGEGTLVGGLAGSALLTLLPIAFQPIALYKTMVEGAVLVLAFQYLPDGIVGGLWRLVGRVARLERPGALAPQPSATTDRPSPHRRSVAEKTPALEAAGLAKRFGGLQAVADVSFAVPDGSITALIGPNGAGKTTVFNLITNLFPADRGDVRFYGRSLFGLAPGDVAALGLLRTFQTARVLPGMTTLENLLAGAHRQIKHGAAQHMLWLPQALREERSLRRHGEALLGLVGLGRFRDVAATTLPMGAQKLLEVCRALMARPRLLLLDEPAAGLNDAETAELGALLCAIRDAGLTILLVEHNMALVMDVADQVIVLDLGALLAHGTPRQIQGDRRVIEAYLGVEEKAS
jgi:ABC-type branched-subunit amino acid transport system permease subunit/ABC-type branched-subunit amino acid transport system ATPase component